MLNQRFDIHLACGLVMLVAAVGVSQTAAGQDSGHLQRASLGHRRSCAKHAQRANHRRHIGWLPGIEAVGLHGTCHRCGRTMGDAGAVRHAHPLGGQLHAATGVSNDGSRGRCAGGALRRRRALPRSVQWRRRHLRGPRESHDGENAWGGYLRGGPVSHGYERPLLGVWRADTNRRFAGGREARGERAGHKEARCGEGGVRPSDLSRSIHADDCIPATLDAVVTAAKANGLEDGGTRGYVEDVRDAVLAGAAVVTHTPEGPPPADIPVLMVERGSSTSQPWRCRVITPALSTTLPCSTRLCRLR